MNVYNNKIKRNLDLFYKDSLKGTLKSWEACRTYIRETNLESNKKLVNWYSYLLWKKLKRQEGGLFEYYLKKVLQKKPLQKRLLKNNLMIQKDEP